MKAKILQHIEKIELPKPATLIIQQLRELITQGILKPGSRLPSENALAKAFGVSRGQIREALKRLEFFGVLSTVPQIGTYVAEMGIKSLEGVLSNILHLQQQDYQSLNDTRAVLEIHAAELAAVRATDDEIQEIITAQELFSQRRAQGARAFDEDMYFHLKISEYSHSSVLTSLITLLAPDIIKEYLRIETLHPDRPSTSVEEHERIIVGLQSRNSHQAAQAMEDHMQQVLMLGKSLNISGSK